MQRPSTTTGVVRVSYVYCRSEKERERERGKHSIARGAYRRFNDGRSTSLDVLVIGPEIRSKAENNPWSVPPVDDPRPYVAYPTFFLAVYVTRSHIVSIFVWLGNNNSAAMNVIVISSGWSLVTVSYVISN